ncbi:hypothetical protein GHU05_04490 [Fructobacillus tropaeoli]|uniref:hypothetical protein n=1 Tax=Fructobacillus tropaeoli TaxID=709323 RepID=UPI001455DD58|nr:hypothetical protein [Fructobacillus tropaeoli]NLS38188.1 hypothetical protein [Fructobacillus tropaeoli]
MLEMDAAFKISRQHLNSNAGTKKAVQQVVLIRNNEIDWFKFRRCSSHPTKRLIIFN